MSLVWGPCGCGTGPASGGDASATFDGAVTDLGAGAEAGAEAADVSAPDCSLSVDAAAPTDGGITGLRGGRYCEVLLATLASGALNVDVYNTQGLSDCPQDAWAALDPAALRPQNTVTMAVRNGPRY